MAVLVGLLGKWFEGFAFFSHVIHVDSVLIAKWFISEDPGKCYVKLECLENGF